VRDYPKALLETIAIAERELRRLRQEGYVFVEASIIENETQYVVLLQGYESEEERKQHQGG